MSNLKTLAASELLVGTVTEAIALFIAFRINQLSGFWSAVLVFISASWLLYNLSSLEKLWNTASMLTDPAKSSVLFFTSSSIYLGVKGIGGWNLFLMSVGIGLVGAASGMLFYKYWTIGD